MRKGALENLLLGSPRLRDKCHWRKKNSIVEAYRHVTGLLVWESRVDADAEWMISHFESVLQELECQSCQQDVQICVQDLLDDWGRVKRTI